MNVLRCIMSFCTQILQYKINLYGYPVSLFNCLAFAFCVCVVGHFIFKIFD